jgi:hypothetical protein
LPEAFRFLAGDVLATFQRSSIDRSGGGAGGKLAGTRKAPGQRLLMK